MNVFPLQNANASVISVTGTAAYLLALIDTAGSVSHSFYPSLDAVDLTAENGDIRIMIDPSTGALAPTATKGFLIKQGATLMLRHTNLRYIKLISTSGTVSCSLQIGESEPEETTVISGGGGAITSIIPGTSATSLGKAEDAAHASGDTGVAILAKRTDSPASSAGTDGDYATVNEDSLGHLWSREGFVDGAVDNTNNVFYTQTRWAANATAKPTATTNLSFTTATISSSPITIVGVRVINTTASSRYLFLNNATSIAGAAAPTHAPIFVPANGTAYETTSLFTPAGHYYSTALTIGNSSTPATFTAGSAGDLLVTIYTQS